MHWAGTWGLVALRFVAGSAGRMSLWRGRHGAKQELAGLGAGEEEEEEEAHPCGAPRSWQSSQRSSGSHREAVVAWIWQERTLSFWSLAPVKKHEIHYIPAIRSVICNQDIMTVYL